MRRLGAIAAFVAWAGLGLVPSAPATPVAPFVPAGALGGYSREVKAAINDVSEKRIKEHAFWLAADAQEGRECGTLSSHRVAQYIANYYKALGVDDPVGDGTHVQWFTLPSGSPKRGKLEHVNYCVVAKKKGDRRAERFEYEGDLRPLVFSGDGGIEGTVVFAGYGISASEHGYDDYAGIDVTDKIVLALAGGPGGPDGPFAGGDAAAHAAPRKKAEVAKAKGAVALLIAGTAELDPSDPHGDFTWPPAEKTKRLDLPCVLLSMRAADAVFKLGNKRRTGVKAAIDKTLEPASAAMPRAWVNLNVAAQGPQLGMGANICALYKATAKDAVDEYIVIGAHRDHVGYGKARGSSRGKPGEIHNGADDNASGTCGLLELVRVLVENKLELRRHVLILHFDGEEKGLWGSKHYAGAPLVPMKHTVAMLNMDMIGRNATNEMFCGPEEDERNPALQRILLKISARFRIKLPGTGMKQYMHRSDQWPFMQKGVPAIFLFGGMHKDYHTHNDDPEKLNFTKIANISKLILLFAVEVAALDERP